ncbi:MAG: hypothetical protein KJO40_13645 [Deltaproteobacteria bacterium]|nr:hypothetical protein [Deltaproteobacteria bacterium]
MAPNDYIAIPQADADGRPLDDEILPVNTDAEIAEAELAIRDAGLASLPVLRGDPPDTIETSLILFAAKRRCECGEWSGERCEGDLDELGEVRARFVPEYLRSTAQAARTRRGVWTAITVSPDCAEHMLENAPDWAQAEWLEEWCDADEYGSLDEED